MSVRHISIISYEEVSPEKIRVSPDVTPLSVTVPPELASSLLVQGFTMPIVVDKEYVIIDGVRRLEYVKNMKLSTVPVVRLGISCTEDPLYCKAIRHNLNEVKYQSMGQEEKLLMVFNMMVACIKQFNEEESRDMARQLLHESIPDKLVRCVQGKFGIAYSAVFKYLKIAILWSSSKNFFRQLAGMEAEEAKPIVQSQVDLETPQPFQPSPTPEVRSPTVAKALTYLDEGERQLLMNKLSSGEVKVTDLTKALQHPKPEEAIRELLESRETSEKLEIIEEAVDRFSKSVRAIIGGDYAVAKALLTAMDEVYQPDSPKMLPKYLREVSKALDKLLG